MKLSEVAIGRPVLASMASAALVLFGVIGYSRLSVREFPDVDPPVISVTTTLPGANAQVVETAVTDILEEELSTIQGLRTLTSVSQEEFSLITLEFTLDRPVDVAAHPRHLEPVIAKQEADAQPFIYLALSGANYDLMQLSDVADRIVKTRLQSLPGVCRAFGLLVTPGGPGEAARPGPASTARVSTPRSSPKTLALRTPGRVCSRD